MSRHNTPGKVFIGGSYKGGRNVGGQDITGGITTNKNNKKTKTKKDDSDTKKGKQTFKSKFVYGGSEGVDESVKKENYEDPRKHNLRNQFDYLVDKYYGGTEEGAKEFAKTSQGQLLLGYLSGVSADKGGGRGGDREALLTGLSSTSLTPKTPISAFDIRNLNVPNIREKFTTGGIEDTAAFKRFNEALQVLAPKAYAEARPFSSGQGVGNIIERFVPAYISGPLSNLLPKATGGLTPDEYLDQDLFANLPIDERVDAGGVNDVAQSIINNQMQEEEGEGEGEFDITQFDPNSFIQGFGFPLVDPSLFNLDGTGITGLQI